MLSLYLIVCLDLTHNCYVLNLKCCYNCYQLRCNDPKPLNI